MLALTKRFNQEDAATPVWGLARHNLSDGWRLAPCETRWHSGCLAQARGALSLGPPVSGGPCPCLGSPRPLGGVGGSGSPVTAGVLKERWSEVRAACRPCLPHPAA